MNWSPASNFLRKLNRKATYPLIILLLFICMLYISQVSYDFGNKKGVASCGNKRVTCVSNATFYGILDITADYTLKQELRKNFETIVIENLDKRDNTNVHILYLSKDSKLVVPSLLSDYDFILFTSNHFSNQGYGLAGLKFTNNKFTPLDEVETQDYIYTTYSADDGYWGTLNIKAENKIPRKGMFFHEEKIVPEDMVFYGGVILHAKSKETLENFKDIATKNMAIIDGTYTTPTSSAIPDRILKPQNYTDSNGKYTLYLPESYKFEKQDEYSSNELRLNAGTKNMCIALKGISNEPCGFSTSGCTCCNTGCGFLDLVLYLSPNGDLEMETVLTKGPDGNNARFVYSPNNRWILYSSSFSSDDVDYRDGVIELIIASDSVERTY